MTLEELNNPNRPTGLYKIIFKDGTFGYYDFRFQLTRDPQDNLDLPKAATSWLKHFPFANYGNFKDQDTFVDNVKEVVPVSVSYESLDWDDAKEKFAELRKEYEQFKEFERRWFEVVQEQQVFGVNEDNTMLGDKEIVHLYNLWINNAHTQAMLSNWCTPSYGYTDIEVEDLDMVLLHCFQDAIAYYKANEASKVPMVEDFLNITPEQNPV